jgi:hypothetical protein
MNSVERNAVYRRSSVSLVRVPCAHASSRLAQPLCDPLGERSGEPWPTGSSLSVRVLVIRMRDRGLMLHAAQRASATPVRIATSAAPKSASRRQDPRLSVRSATIEHRVVADQRLPFEPSRGRGSAARRRQRAGLLGALDAIKARERRGRGCGRRSLVSKFVTNGKKETLRALFGESRGILLTDRAAALSLWALDWRQICWAHLLRTFVSFSERARPAAAIGGEVTGERRHHVRVLGPTSQQASSFAAASNRRWRRRERPQAPVCPTAWSRSNWPSAAALPPGDQRAASTVHTVKFAGVRAPAIPTRARIETRGHEHPSTAWFRRAARSLRLFPRIRPLRAQLRSGGADGWTTQAPQTCGYPI